MILEMYDQSKKTVDVFFSGFLFNEKNGFST
jgi:hypothetical protein